MEVWRHKSIRLTAGVTDKKEALATVGYYRKFMVKKAIPIEAGLRAGAVLDPRTRKVKSFFGLAGRIAF